MQSATITAEWVHIKVRPKSRKRFEFLTSNGGINHLRIHASLFRPERAEQVISEIRAEHGDKYELKTEPAFTVEQDASLVPDCPADDPICEGSGNRCQDDSERLDDLEEALILEGHEEDSTEDQQIPAEGVEISIVDYDKMRAALSLAELAARMTQDRECANCHSDGDKPNAACDEHEAFDMESDDAVETVNGLILRAREVLGI